MVRQLLACLTFLALSACSAGIHHSPGTLHDSSTDALTDTQLQLRAELQRDVGALSVDIGPRNAGESLESILAAEQWLSDQLHDCDLQSRRIEIDLGGTTVANVEATVLGTERPDEIIVIGAHYDTVFGSPGANDNASGVAMVLAAARALNGSSMARTVRFVFFVNEEDPFTGGIQMGSRVYAKRCRADHDNIVAMIAVDSVGYFSSSPGSQRYPPLISGLPSVGNFVAFGADHEHVPLLDRTVALFQQNSRFPSIGVALDRKTMARGDHAAFWWEGYPAISMSDTSEFRDPNYHRPTDVIGNLNFDDMARLTTGFIQAVHAMANAEATLPSSGTKHTAMGSVRPTTED